MDLIPGRAIHPGQYVKVYVNLNKQGRFSIVDMKTGLVCAYVTNCTLTDAQYYVSASGRRKVNETKRKMVHAWVRGYLQEVETDHPDDFHEPVTYNPYLNEAFVNSDNHIIDHAPEVFMANKKTYIR